MGGGPAATTLEVAIYQSLRFDFDPPRAIALALLQIALTGLVLAVLATMRRPEERILTLGGAKIRFDGRTLAKRTWDTLWIAMAVAFLLLPLVAVVSAGLQADLGRLVTSSTRFCGAALLILWITRIILYNRQLQLAASGQIFSAKFSCQWAV